MNIQDSAQADDRISFRGRGSLIGLVPAGLSLIIATLVLLLGWWGGVDTLTRIFPEYPAMVPATSFALTAAAVAALSLHMGSGRLMPLLGAAVMLVALTMSTTQLAFLDPPRATDTMSIATKVCVVLLAISIALRALDAGVRILIPQILETITASFALALLFGYLFRSQDFLNVPGISEAALHTALCLMLISLSLLALDRTRGWVITLLSPDSGSLAIRQFLPIIVTMMLIYCALSLFLANQTTLSINFRFALFCTLMVLTLFAFGLVMAQRINALHSRNAKLEAMFRGQEKAAHATEIAAERIHKVEALASLVGGVAHDFNNTLAVIRGNLELLEMEPLSADGRSFCREAVIASEHGANLTRQLLAYGGRAHLEPSLHAAGPLIAETIQMFRRVAPANIEVKSNLEQVDFLLEIDGPTFCQVFLNVLINARDALPKGGLIHITTKKQHISALHAHRFNGDTGIPVGEYILIKIRDNGVGMTTHTQTHAFEPFFTTKDVGQGSGLGLSSAFGFCQQSLGGMMIESEVGQGTAVTMAFPAHETTVPRSGKKTPQRTSASPTASILLVEDNVAVKKFMTTYLEKKGHIVCAVGTAEAALDLLESGANPAVLITDVGLPGKLQGNDLAKRVSRDFPDLRVVIVSGNYDLSADDFSIQDRDRLSYLQKPFDGRSLQAVLANAED